MGTECREVLGVSKIILYENKGVKFLRPDISKPNEVNFIWSGSENYVIDYTSFPKWKRIIDYSKNYRPIFADQFSFLWYGNEKDESIQSLRKNRNGFIVEIQTVTDESFVFPAPVFVSEITETEKNVKTWEIILNYRQPTFLNYLTKLNTIIMTGSYLLINNNGLLISKNNTVLTWQ